MEELSWQKVVKFETENNLVNDNYRLGQAVRQIIRKDTESLLLAIKILQNEVDERTSIKK